MKLGQLLHNPGAGDEEHDKDELIALIKANGFDCRYSSTKKKILKDVGHEIDFLIVAGGDGTLRSVAKEMVERKIIEKIWPIGLLPLGTANNIAKSLKLAGETEDLIRTWHYEKFKNFDIGYIHDFGDDNFFLESFGFGVFPYLMMKMKKPGKSKIDDPEEKIQTALQILHDIILSYDAKDCQLDIDGQDYSGKYLLAEIMNTKSIGPNLFLASEADPGDGLFNVIVIPDADREKFASYVFGKINGKEEEYDFLEVKGKKVTICWDGTHVHVDDEVVKLKKKEEIKLELKENLFRFFVP